MGKSKFALQFWGVRGSIPTAGSDTARFGGNTPCIEVRCGNELLILDAGSGIRPLGETLVKKKKPVKAAILFSHLHWDHVQGFPFFVPAYIPGNQLTLIAQERNGLGLREAISGVMTYPYFPVALDTMAAQMNFQNFRVGETFRIGDVRVSTFPTIHPQAGCAFRIEYGGRSLLYATDTEHPSDGSMDANLLEAARNVECLIYDTTFTDKEYLGNGKGHGSKVGWGHSTWEKGVELAKAAGAKQLILFHHDPARTDKQMTVIERQVKKRFPKARAAREGLLIQI